MEHICPSLGTGKNIIVLREGRISPYIESVPQPNVNYLEEDLGVYSIFVDEGDTMLEPVDFDDGMWHMHFDGSCSNEGNGANIILYSPIGKIHNFSYRLEFSCTNNVTEFEALLLGIENAYNLGCGHLTVFGDSELVVNLVRKIYSPSNKLLKHYTQVVWMLISNLLSFNITHVKRELNSMADRLVVFAASPTRQLLPQRPDCTFQSLYRPHIPDNVESWQVFPSDEGICAFIQNEPFKPKEIISIEDDKFPKGLTPLESSFSSSDVGNKETHKEEESKRKVGDTISLNIGTSESPKIIKLGAQCSDEEKEKFTELLHEFQDVFSWSYEDLRGFDPALIQHAIPIKEGVKPVRKKQRPINPALEATIRKELEKLLKANIIFPVKYSDWVSNLVPVRKTTGQIRLCVDFRALNRASVKDHFPLPNMEMILQQVAGSQMMSLLDGFSGYNQIKVKRTDRYKTTFTTRWGTFSYEHMPFGLSNAGATFQRDMQIDFDDLIGKIIQVYLDDLTVYSKNRLDHFGHLRKVLMRCRKFGISLNPSKSIFGVTKGKLLGHIVSDSGISIDPERITAILNLPAPTSKKEVQAFMGIINFVRRFVPDFVVMVKPIHNLLKQDHSFSWTDDVENAFLRIKKAISSAPVLAKPDFEKDFIIYTNATEEAISAILLQCDDQNNEKHVAYMSQSLSDDEIKYSYIEKHVFSLVKAIEKFHHFILGKHTQVKVPLPAVKFLLSQTYLSGKLAHWLAKIQEHDLTIMTSKTIKG
jgi:ribonuclease HI